MCIYICIYMKTDKTRNLQMPIIRLALSPVVRHVTRRSGPSLMQWSTPSPEMRSRTRART